MMRRPFVRNLLVGLLLSFLFSAVHPAPAFAGTVHHYEYVLTSGFIYVYDMDNGGNLVKRVSVPTTAGVRGAVASAATGMLYISYGSDSSGGFQLAYNLSTDQVAWTMSYSHGVDSASVSPDGTKLYMPSGELSSGGTWYVESTTDGSDIGTIQTGGTGPHNTIVSPNGLHVYMGDRDYNLSSSAPGVNDFSIASTATNQIIGTVSPLKSGARPFTINSKETFSFNTLTAFLGFQVGDLTTGKVLYTVAIDGSNIPNFTTQTSATIPSHGVSLSPDDRELYIVDQPNSYVHVFDVTGLPGSAPVQVADIPLVNPMSGNQTECAYDCLRDGWIQHSRDGRFVNVGDSGDVIDTLTRKTIATLPAMLNSRVEIEIDFQDSTPIWAATSRSAVGYANPAPPTFTARITSPALGSTVSGANVAVTTSVVDTATISSVDLLKDGVLYATTTASPYTFTWDSTKDANGPHTLTITANDTVGNTTSFSASFAVNNVNVPNPPSITTTSLPGGTQNVAYNAALAATGGKTPYTWSIASGNLHPGLMLTPGGAITGTPTGSGTSNFTVQVTDANSQTATKALSLTVTGIPTPSIATLSLPNGAQKVAYNASLSATGGTTPYTWSIAAGNLPAGLTLASGTGAITGTPTGSGTSNFSVMVTDANSQTATKSLSVTVTAIPTPSITTVSLPNGTQKVGYNATLAAAGGTTPYTWSIASGNLPAGLSLAPGTGAISGTPTGSGASNFTVMVTDANSQTATKALSIAVSAIPSPSITTASLPNGTQKVSYNATLAATGGTTPYTWSLATGTLPAGLTLAAGTGAISGTPTASGTSNFSVMVTDANSQTATRPLRVTVTAIPVLSITTASLPNATQKVGYDAALAATGGTTPYTWSIASGNLPAGLTLAPGSGMITGTPSGSGASNFSVMVTDANSQTATKSLSLTVTATAPPSITPTGGTPQSTTINSAFGAALIATVKDSGGHPLSGLTVTFTAPAQTGSSGTFAGGVDTATTNASGVAASPIFTANGIAGGPYVVTASVPGATTPANFSLTNDPKLAVSVTTKAGTPQRSIVNTALHTALKASVSDTNGQPLPNVSVTFTAPSSGASGTFAGGAASSTVTTDASGIASAPAFTANSIGGGPYNVTASVAGNSTPATYSLTNIDFALSQSSPGAIQLAQGMSASAGLTLTTTPAGSTLPADVDFTCTATITGLNTACTLSPSKFLANSPSGSHTTLTVTMAASLPPASGRKGPRTPYLPMAATTVLAGLLTISFAARRKFVLLPGRMAYLSLALLAIASAGMMGCVGLTSANQAQSSVSVTATSGGVSKTTVITVNMK